MSSSSTPLLKPMTAGDILDRAIRIYRENFIALVTIVALVNVPLVLVQVVATAATFPFTQNLNSDSLNNLNAATIFFAATAVSGLLGALGAIYVHAAIAAFVSQRFLGKPATVRQAYSTALRRWLSLLIAAVLVFLANFGLLGIFALVYLLPLVGFSALGNGGSGSAGLTAVLGIASLCICVLIVPALLFTLFLNTRWSFWTQTIILESYNSTGGLGRSWKLTRGTFWRVLGFNLILTIIVSAFSLGPISLFSLGTAFLPSPILGAVLQNVASSAIVIIMTPLQFATLTVLYYDLRIRKEGFDLQMQLEDMTGTSGAVPMPSPVNPPPAQPTEQTITPTPAVVPPPNTLTEKQPSPSTDRESPLDLPPLFSREDYTPK